MAKAKFEIPKELLNQVKKLEHDTPEMMKAMVEAGAETVLERMKSNAPAGMKSSPIMNCLSSTRPYEAPSDDSINVKVGFAGYFTNEDGVRTPAPLVANIFEYGRSNSPFPKQPFMRKSFNKGAITKAMEAVQKKYIPEE
ncbi:MAG: HK97 gp10 family phage protein [Ruminococcus sp.]|nr:HK97 gp10 family phage protein [Ruminococcus sp.]